MGGFSWMSAPETMLMPIVLTDSELDIVMRAAQPLAVNDRDAFLQDVAKHLATLPVRGDGIVHRVCAEVQHKHWNPPVGIEVVGPLPRKYGTL
jgi:hypothetical protein